MAFGGFFGGGSGGGNSDNSSSSSTSKNASLSQPSEFSDSSPSSTTASPIFSSSSGGSSASSSEIKNRLTQAISQQSNILNAKALIGKINENCFDHCVGAPGTSLSSKEQGCLSSCMEKYIEGWNVVSRSYVGRLQREGAQVAGAPGGNGGMF